MERLSCFVTEKIFIECFYLDNENYTVAIYNESLAFLQKIKIDTVDKEEVFEKLHYILEEYEEYEDYFDIDNFRIFINCIHLKKEIGIFTYYKYTISNFVLIMQLNELIINGTNYEFNRIKVGGNEKIYLSLTNPNYKNQFCYSVTENLMKINDNKFTYVYYNYDEGEYCHFIVLIIFELFGDNNDNLVAKYYKIDISNTLGINGIEYFFNLDTFIHKSYIGIVFLCFFYESDSESYLIIFGNPEQNINEIELNLTLNYEWKINDDFNITIHNNLFGYELAYRISPLPDSLHNLKLFSLNNNNEINSNTKIDYNDSLIFDYSNVYLRFTEQPILEIIALIIEPDYNKSLYLCDKADIFGELPNNYEEKIIDEKKLKVKLNFECYTTCKECNYAGKSITNQKCLSCKEDNNLCFMEYKGNCYNISNSNYGTYTDSDNNLICFSEEENPPDVRTNSDESTEDTTKSSVNDSTKSSENAEDTTKTSENLDSNVNTEAGSEFNSNESSEEFSSDIPNAIIDFFNEIYDRIKNGSLDEEINENGIIIYGNNMTIEATTTEKQKYYIDNGIITNLSLIDLSQCEKKLGLNKPLILLKMDKNINDNFAPQVEYIAINPDTHEKINLSKCEGTKINIYIPFNISETLLNLYVYAENQGYNIFNPSDPFYNDICTPFNSPSKTDVLLKDRKKDYYNEYAFCEEKCNFDRIDLPLNKAKCDCEIKKEIKKETKFSTMKLLENFYKISSYSNFKTLACFSLVFRKESFKKNYGGFILIFIIVLFISSTIAGIITYSKKVKQILDSILNQKRQLYYMSKNNNNNNSKYPVKEKKSKKHSKEKSNKKKFKKDKKEKKVKKKEIQKSLQK